MNLLGEVSGRGLGFHQGVSAVRGGIGTNGTGMDEVPFQGMGDFVA